MESAETAQEASSSIIRAARVNAGDNISALAVFVPGGQTSEPPAWRFPAMIAALFGALALVVVMLMATSFNSATEQTSPNMPMNIKVFDEPGCDVTILAKETGMQCAGKSAGDTVTLTRKKKEAHFLADREVWGVLYEYDGKRCYAPVIAGEIVWKCVIRKSDPQLVVYHF